MTTKSGCRPSRRKTQHERKRAKSWFKDERVSTLGAREIHERKGLKKSQKILDHMGSTELAANLFRATQTDEKLRRENIRGKYAANEAHFQVGKKVRETIKELGGTKPEDLPTPEKSIAQIEREQEQRKLKSGDEN